MRRAAVFALSIMLAATALAAATAASQQRPSGMTFDEYVFQSGRLEWTPGGVLELSQEVMVTGRDSAMTCDRLRLWPTPDGRHAERAEAAGNIVVRGRYLSSDKTEWQVVGKANSGTYERKSGQGVLQGAVRFEATNVTTGAVFSVEADKMVYDFNTGGMQFVRVDTPVRGQWQEPVSEAGATTGGAQPTGGQTESQP